MGRNAEDYTIPLRGRTWKEVDQEAYSLIAKYRATTSSSTSSAFPVLEFMEFEMEPLMGTRLGSGRI